MNKLVVQKEKDFFLTKPSKAYALYILRLII